MNLIQKKSSSKLSQSMYWFCAIIGPRSSELHLKDIHTVDSHNLNQPQPRSATASISHSLSRPQYQSATASINHSTSQPQPQSTTVPVSHSLNHKSSIPSQFEGYFVSVFTVKCRYTFSILFAVKIMDNFLPVFTVWYTDTLSSMFTVDLKDTCVCVFTISQLYRYIYLVFCVHIELEGKPPCPQSNIWITFLPISQSER